MNNGWTGGQYSLFRAIFGTYLFVHFVRLLPWGAEVFSNRGVLPEASASPIIYLFPNVLAFWDSPLAVSVLLTVAAVLTVPFVIGLSDRSAAVALWYVWACLFGRDPLIANPGLPYVGWMLLAHAFVPAAPYGSWAARGRPDAGGSWRMPPGIFAVAWILMALGYSYSGATKLVSPSWLDGSALTRVLSNPLARPGPVRDLILTLPSWFLHLATWGALALELAFAPAALVAWLRPWVWCLMVLMHFSLILVLDFADLSLGMVILHLFTFDPGWIPPRSAPGDMVFYDGHCGLCHRMVRFVLAEDRTEAIRFAPLDSAAFRKAVAENVRPGLPDSLVVLAGDGRLLTRSAGVIHILRSLGGVWRILGKLAAMLPLPLRDRFYDGIAHIRYRLFGRPAGTCPMIPAHLRARFELAS